jgi:DNA-binding PadR family transcriptional regulator
MLLLVTQGKGATLMEKMILGILMMSQLTVYEIRAVIRANFQAMCSDSMGSIQAAIKRLLDAEAITVSEYVEKGVNKKRYSITEKGRAQLMDWLQTPANISGAKNMELGKFLFMGMLPAEKQMPLIKEIIRHLEEDLAQLLDIQAGITPDQKAGVIAYWQSNPAYYSDVLEKATSIAKFEELTLQYGIDTTKFNIEWFKRLVKKG